MVPEQVLSTRGAASAPLNWQLALLASTALALSVASGWTTWDGMTNFTDSRWLSFLITFGIQGVMLISAWLIGETFARQQTEAHTLYSTSATARSVRLASTVMSVIAFILVAIAGLLWLDLLPSGPGSELLDHLSLTGLTAAAIGLLLVATLISHRDIGEVYLLSSRTILRNLPLWIMFLMCMAASVFFSFDSLFTRIFPPTERARASDIRAQRDLAVILAEATMDVAKNEADAVDDLFRSKAWIGYTAHTQSISAAAQQAAEALQGQHAQEVTAAKEADTRKRAKLARLKAEKTTLQSRRDRLATDLADKRSELNKIDARANELTVALRGSTNALQDLQTAMESELRGVGRTGVAGRGPVYREFQRQQVQLQIEADALRKKRNEQTEWRAQTQAHIVELETATAKMAGDLAQLDSEMGLGTDQSQQFAGGAGGIAVLDALKTSTAALVAARQAFQQSVTSDALLGLQQACSKSVVILSKTASEYATDQAASRCETSELKRLVGTIADRQRAAVAFATSCGKSAIPAGASASDLITIGRQCIRTASLDASQTTQLGSALNQMALRRDDAAHRFVVTTNAFLDGNQLAYLALLIAIAIDSLIFISGLFGAAAAAPSTCGAQGQFLWRSMAQPSAAPDLSDQQALITVGAAGFHRKIAESLLTQVQPIIPAWGYTHTLLGKQQPNDIISALNAGIAAGMVHWKQDPEPQYLISPAFLIALARGGIPELLVDQEDGEADIADKRVTEERVSHLAS